MLIKQFVICKISKEGFFMSTEMSSNWNDRLKNIMPWGSSTSSKAPQMLPDEPEAIDRGKGCRVWDVKGKEYIDFRNGLGPVTLGYCFPEIDTAIKEQLEKGIVFSHPSTLECEVAEMLSEVIPCAQQVRFLKTGGEAVAACIKLARYYTGREHIIQIGYNGWLNVLAFGGSALPGQVSNSLPAGVPLGLAELHHTSGWNDEEKLKKIFEEYHGKIAAVVVSADYEKMVAGKTFYPFLRDITNKNGSILIYDEIVTGFRIALGGVQEYFGVTPDLAVFSKGIANGMPISAYVGKKDIMKGCDKGGISISSTFGGETLSLAACKATINIYKTQNVVDHLWKQGGKLWSAVNNMFEAYDIAVELKGFWPCPAFTVKKDAPEGIISKIFRSAYRNGLSLYNVSYVNFSHKDKDVQDTLARFDIVCKGINA